MQHQPLLSRNRGKVSVSCTCGMILCKPRRYVDPIGDIFEPHVLRAEAARLQERFAARRGF